MAGGVLKIEDFTLTVALETQVKASLEDTFAAVLDQIGPKNETPDGKPLPMKVEAWPGGRWYRDLGEGKGHYWATVQAIKRPTLLEFCGPLLASYPLLSNVQYRLSEVKGGTLIAFRHTALGFIREEDRKGVREGWTWMMTRIRERAEAPRPH